MPGEREMRWLAVGEFTLVAALYAADVWRLVPISKTIFLVPLGWISLRWRGLGWTDVGLRRPRHGWRTVGLGLLAGLGMLGLEIFVSYPLLTRLTGQPPDLSGFQPIVGNFGKLLIVVALIWVVAVLGEELGYRGYLMSRAAGLGGGTTVAWTLSLLGVSIVFGAGHIDQGLTGMMENTVNGLLLGLLYLGTGRNLVAPIVAHGFTNTADLVLIYLGRYPGL